MYKRQSWGYNYLGQLGLGDQTQRTIPTAVTGLSGVARIAAGDSFTLALTFDESVWGWGWNTTYYSLGDGTATNAYYSPLRISDPGLAWKVGTPVANYGPGTYPYTFAVSLSDTTTGASIRYTVDGTEPTEADSLLYTVAIPVDQTTTLRARAFKAGLAASNVLVNPYVLKVPVATFTPGPGTYPTAQSVTLTSAVGASIYFTTDGGDPSESSTPYTGPIPIATTSTIKTRAYRLNWSPSDIGSGTYTMNFGALSAPTMSPGTGTYISSQDVTLTAAGAAEIRYTTNNTDPTPTSTLYSSPVALTATTTLTARAFHPNYLTSPTTTGIFTIEVATPTFTPDGGTYAAGQAIVIATATPGATIHYTQNGVDPTLTDPAITSGSSILAGNFTLKARAIKTGATTSHIKSADYIVTGSVTTGAVAAGASHSLAATSDGTVWAWGYNNYGQLGNGNQTQQPSPVRVQGLTGINAVAAGVNHSVALATDGTVWAWGANGNGELGDGTTVTQRSLPVQVSGLTGVVAIAVGDSHSLALKADGSVWAWGLNSSGQLGDGTSGNSRRSPVQVPISGITAIAAGDYHSLAVKSDGSAWAWGYNGTGQLGNGTVIERTTPVAVSGLTGAVGVAGGSFHSVAFQSDGTAWAWGYNQQGQLGDTTSTQRLMPVQVSGLTNVEAGSAGNHHTLFLRSDGTVWATGYSGYGQIGDGTTGTVRYAPVQVLGAIAAGISAGQSHNLAVTADGIVWAWGLNNTYQLGDGTTVLQASPITVSAAGFQWKVGTPTLSVPSGTYPANQNPVVT